MAKRWLLVGLVLVLGALLWVVAAWPVQPEAVPTAGLAAMDGLAGMDGMDGQAGSAGSGALTDQAQQSAPAANALTARSEEAIPADGVEDEAAAVEAPPQPAQSAEEAADQVFIRENGPLAEYKQRFEREPRDSAAHDFEQTITQAFVSTDGPGPVFRAVLCRESICRIDVRVSQNNLGAYVAAMARIVAQRFDSKLATERTSLVEGGEVSVSVYAQRPGEDTPAPGPPDPVGEGETQ